MSERKVINKYYPPNFNPMEAEQAARKLSKKLKTMNKDSITIRLMTPFSIRCLKCSEYIAKSRKFNGKKELLPERYLDSIKVYRLSIKCPRCNNMICFRTDPKSGDYIMEIGGVRNHVKKQTANQEESLDETLERLEREQQEENSKTENGQEEDKLAELEKRLAKFQQEQEDDEKLEQLRKHNVDKMKRAEELSKKDEDLIQKQEEVDELLAVRAFQQFENNDLDQIPNDKVVEQTSFEPSHASKPSTIPKRIQIKKKNKTNSLGVLIKKKRKV